MAGTAGIAFLHLGHRPAPIAGTGEKQPVMAVTACLEFQVLHMGETGIVGKKHIPHGVTGAAVGSGSYGKRGLAIVARAA